MDELIHSKCGIFKVSALPYSCAYDHHPQGATKEKIIQTLVKDVKDDFIKRGF